MPERPGFPAPFTFSQSSLQDYSECPRRFQLRYLERLAWPAVESEPALENERRQREGQIFHQLVQQARLGLPAEALERLAVPPDLNRWWANYREHAPQLDGYAQYTELSLAAPMAGHRLVAKYDLVAIRPGEKALIFDWKTSRRRPRDEVMAARWQTRLYRAMLVLAGASLNGGKPWQPEQVEMVYWYAEFPTQPARFAYPSAQYQRDTALLAGIVAEIASAARYEMTEEIAKCSLCPYRSYCERGGPAGEGGDLGPESQEAGFDIDQVQEIAF